MAHLVAVEAFDVLLTVDTVSLVVNNLVELVLLDLVLLTVSALVAFLTAMVAHGSSLIVGFLLVRPRPVLRIREVGQLLQGGHFVDDDRFEVALLAIRAVGAETHYVVWTYLLASHLVLHDGRVVILYEATLFTFKAETSLKLRANFV